jgi:hypothetical protein
MGSFAKLARRAVETDAPVMVKVTNSSYLVGIASLTLSFLAFLGEFLLMTSPFFFQIQELLRGAKDVMSLAQVYSLTIICSIWLCNEIVFCDGGLRLMERARNGKSNGSRRSSCSNSLPNGFCKLFRLKCTSAVQFVSYVSWNKSYCF